MVSCLPATNVKTEHDEHTCYSRKMNFLDQLGGEERAREREREREEGQIIRWIDRCICRLMVGWTDGWIERQMDGLMERGIDSCTYRDRKTEGRMDK